MSPDSQNGQPGGAIPGAPTGLGDAPAGPCLRHWLAQRDRRPYQAEKSVQIADEQEACRRRSSEAAADRETGAPRRLRCGSSSRAAPLCSYDEPTIYSNAS
jgi:hypothetical protein